MEYVNLALALLLVLANGFFVATEFALVKIRGTRLKGLVEEGRPGAALALGLVTRLDRALSATQLGITLASLALGWIGERAFAHIVEPVALALLPQTAATQALVHTVAAGFAFAVITVLHIVLGEVAPKSLAIQRTESTVLAVAWPMRAFLTLFYPLVVILDWMAAKVLKLAGLRAAEETEEAHSEDELRYILATSAAAGAITEARGQLLERALQMAEKTARQVLVPRTQIRYLDVEEPLEKLVQEARNSGHTWLPVCRGNLDQVEGVVNAKDLFFLLSRNELKSLSQVQRAVLFVPENVTLEQLLSEFRRRRRQMAVVVDEHGGTSGIVTLADVVAEVVGDVAELGRKVDEVKTLPGGRLELPGSAQLDDIEDRLEIEFTGVDDGEVTTIGGYLMARLGKVPERGDKCAVSGYEVVVEAAEGPRITRVRIEPRVQPAVVSAQKLQA